MNTPDKCPNCGANRRLPKIYLDPVFDCGSHLGVMDLVDSRRCLVRQRDQLAATLEAQRRGAATAERLLCEALGVESGADVLDAIAALRARVKRLEEAGDSLADATIPNGRSHERRKEAKEAKP